MAFASKSVVSIGEAMLEMAPVGDGLYRRSFAGDTYNTVWHMAQLLGKQAAAGFVTRIGQDKLSDAFADEMLSDGLDNSRVGRDPDRAMGLYLIELDGVERGFHYWRQFSAARLLADDPVFLAKALTGAGLIHLSGITLAILSPEARQNLFAALAKARQEGAAISFDPNIRLRLWASRDEIRATVPQMLELTDIALPSFDDETAIWGDAAPQETIERLRSSGVGEVVVKNGEGKVWHFSSGAIGECETPPVTGICDTTGAGDAFNAGYLAARLLGHSPAKAIPIAQQLAGIVIRNFGARAPRPDVRTMGALLD